MTKMKMTKKNSFSKLFEVAWYKLAFIVLSLPFFGFIACVLWSIIFQFEATTATHCRVKNYLPSTSAAIGRAPQKYIWRICIGLHCSPRIMVAIAYYTYHISSYETKPGLLYRWMASAATVLHVVENLALLFLTCISSTEEHDVHENLFITFMVSSVLYMAVTCWLFEWRRRLHLLTPKEQTSLLYKKWMFLANVSSFFMAVYFFFRHNSHCEPGVYSVFALLEYVTIMTNILYHASAISDFDGSSEACLGLMRKPQKTN